MSVGGGRVVEGSILRTIFRSQTTGYAVFEVKMEKIMELEKKKLGRKTKAIIVANHSPVMEDGSFIRAKGEWVESVKHGLQLVANSIIQIVPSSPDACKRYLKTFKGIGKKRAALIASAFPNENIFDILENEPKRILEIPGIGKTALEKLEAEWKSKKGLFESYTFLHSIGIGGAIAEILSAKLGGTTEMCAKSVKENPYAVVEESESLLSFPHADRIARKLGISNLDERRIREGVIYASNLIARSNGHTCVSVDEVVKASKKLLNLKDENVIREAVEKEGNGRLPRIDETRVSPLRLYNAEVTIAKRLEEIQKERHPLPYADPELSVRAAERDFGGTGLQRLAMAQQEAVRQAMMCKILVITGGPGVGKTQTIASIVSSFRKFRVPLLCASPTGRAAAKLAQVTKQPCSTIHRLLEFDPNTGKFKRNASNKLMGSFFLIDEASMIDIELAEALFSAIPDRAVVVLVGDIDQLPPIGPGTLLKDLVKSGNIKTVRLEKNFRQEEQTSQIVKVAHSILHELPFNIMPYDVGSGTETFEEFTLESDLRFVGADSPSQILSRVVSVMDDLRFRFGIDIEDMQVLTGMRKGPLGSRALNRVLQKKFNQNSETGCLIEPGGVFSFSPGDRVMQIVNDYQRDIYNGEIGTVVSADERVVVVKYLNQFVLDVDTLVKKERLIEYQGDELRDIEHAFAFTTHKSQGCEFPVVIIPMDEIYSRVLHKNLLYTAVTRASKLAVVVGDMKAFRKAALKNDPTNRTTFLSNRINKD